VFDENMSVANADEVEGLDNDVRWLQDCSLLEIL
jgi:hypothetical protein